MPCNGGVSPPSPGPWGAVAWRSQAGGTWGHRRGAWNGLGWRPREWLASLARKFIDINRRHLVVEEESFLPLALRVLGPEDWAEIDAQVTDREDALFGGAVQERFHALHESILEPDRAGGKSRPRRVIPSLGDTGPYHRDLV